MKEVVQKALEVYIVHFSLTKGEGRLISLLRRPLSSGRYARETVLQPWNLDPYRIRRLLVSCAGVGVDEGR